MASVGMIVPVTNTVNQAEWKRMAPQMRFPLVRMALHPQGDAALLATPYHDALNEHEKHFLADNGIEVVALKGLGIGAGGAHEYVKIARVPPEEVYAHCRSVDVEDAQGMVVSCTDLRTQEILPRLEAELGKPVISSNLATLWMALRSAGRNDRLKGFGRLLEEHR